MTLCDQSASQIDQLTAVIDQQAQFEAKEPAGGRPATLGPIGKRLVPRNSMRSQTASAVASRNDTPVQGRKVPG